MAIYEYVLLGIVNLINETMRGISFRAYDAKQKQYVPEEYISITANGKCENNSLENCWLDPEDWILEQFTGLIDKNGVEIFEGDYILYAGAKGVVFYDDDWAMFLVSFNVSRSKYSFDSMDEPIEVIGKIHETLKK